MAATPSPVSAPFPRPLELRMADAPDPQTPAAGDAVLVDARGLNCPMPVIELAKALRDAPVGTVARLVANDTTTRVDVPVWCRMQRQRLRSAQEATGDDGRTEFTYEVEKVTG